MQDAADLVWRQKMAAALAEEPGPAFAEAVALVPQHPAAIGDRADRGVQAGTVPAAGEDTDAHADYLRCTVILTAYVLGWVAGASPGGRAITSVSHLRRRQPRQAHDAAFRELVAAAARILGLAVQALVGAGRRLG